MGIFKSLGLVITTACSVVVKLFSAFERGANALDEVSKGAEIKARNFTKLVELNDEAEFEKRKAEINAERVNAGLKAVDVKSDQVITKEKEAETKAKLDEAKAKAQQEAEDALI